MINRAVCKMACTSIRPLYAYLTSVSTSFPLTQDRFYLAYKSIVYHEHSLTTDIGLRLCIASRDVSSKSTASKASSQWRRPIVLDLSSQSHARQNNTSHCEYLYRVGARLAWAKYTTDMQQIDGQP